MRYAKFTSVGATCALLIGMVPSAIGLPGQRVGQYDFTYFTSGDARATPVQVFDDGKSTYFQFRAGEAIPAIFSNKEGKVGLLVPSFDGPYLHVAETAGRFTLQLGRSQAQVVYGGNGREDTPPIDAVHRNGLRVPYAGQGYPTNSNVKLLASLGSTLALTSSDSLEANSYATPLKGDRVNWKESETETTERQVYFAVGSPTVSVQAGKLLQAMAADFKGATTITVIGRDDSSEKEGLENARATAIREALVKLGVNPDRITVKVGVMGSPKDKLWPSDIRMERVLPTPVARPSDGPEEKLAKIQASVENLVRAGVLGREQAAAMLRKGKDVRPETETLMATPVAAVTSPPPKPPEVPAPVFDFKATDKTIAGAIRRWAGANNYQVVWDAPPTADAPVTGDVVIAAASMKEALDKVIPALQRKGYDIQATLYSNRVIRFTGSAM